MVPDDAYAVLMLVEQDLYQDADDDFVCGMAAGGSRVAAVSPARYDPVLDEQMEVERAHAWPASDYVTRVCESLSSEQPNQKRPRTHLKKNLQRSDPHGKGDIDTINPLR